MVCFLTESGVSVRRAVAKELDETELVLGFLWSVSCVILRTQDIPKLVAKSGQNATFDGQKWPKRHF